MKTQSNDIVTEAVKRLLQERLDNGQDLTPVLNQVTTALSGRSPNKTASTKTQAPQPTITKTTTKLGTHTTLKGKLSNLYSNLRADIRKNPNGPIKDVGFSKNQFIAYYSRTTEVREMFKRWKDEGFPRYNGLVLLTKSPAALEQANGTLNLHNTNIELKRGANLPTAKIHKNKKTKIDTSNWTRGIYEGENTYEARYSRNGKQISRSFPKTKEGREAAGLLVQSLDLFFGKPAQHPLLTAMIDRLSIKK
jgi:hypothetical protein